MRYAAQIPTLSLMLTMLPCALAQDKNVQKPMAGPRATILRETPLYVSPDVHAQRLDRIQTGRELVIAEISGPWVRVFANTDIEEATDKDAPVFGQDPVTPPVSGWMEAKGVVIETTPNGDRVLMGEAANDEVLAEDPRGPKDAGQNARLLYRRLIELFPQSPLVPEASWRAADIRWQFQKADASTRPSAKERDAYLREQMNEDELKKVIHNYPHTRQADLAAFELIDNKLCGDWQGKEKCPEKESDLYEKYTVDHPDGPRTATALYQAVYRQAVLANMYAADDDKHKSDDAKKHASELSQKLTAKFPQSDFASRAAALVYKLEQGIPVYGIDRED